MSRWALTEDDVEYRESLILHTRGWIRRCRHSWEDIKKKSARTGLCRIAGLICQSPRTKNDRRSDFQVTLTQPSKTRVSRNTSPYRSHMFFHVTVDLIVDIFYEDISWARSILFVLLPEDYGWYLEIVHVFIFSKQSS